MQIFTFSHWQYVAKNNNFAITEDYSQEFPAEGATMSFIFFEVVMWSNPL
jgi:hypothetical protein